MTAIATKPEATDTGLAHRAAQMAAFGQHSDEIAERLMAEGTEPDLAHYVADMVGGDDTRVLSFESDTQDEPVSLGGSKIYGAVLCLCGIVATIISYYRSVPEGTVYIAAGAILGGLAIFIRGLFLDE